MPPEGAGIGRASFVEGEEVRKKTRGTGQLVRLIKSFWPNVTPYEFQAEAIEIINTPASPIRRAISWSIMVACIVGLAWSFLGYLDIVIGARGRVIPSERTSIVQAPEAALVSKIHVQDGATVSAGDLLISLNPTEAFADRDRLRNDLMEARLAQVRLRAVLAAPEDTVEAAKLFVAPDNSTPGAVTRHANQLLSLISEHQARILGLQAERQKRLAEVAGFQAQLEKIEVQLPLIREQTQAKRQLATAGVIARLPLLDAEQGLTAIEAEAKIVQSRLAGTQADVQRLDYDVMQLKAELQRTAFAQLAEAEVRAASLEQELIKAEHRADKLSIKAPVSGYVQQLSVNTLRSVVQPGQQLLIIVPEEGRLEVEARIDNKDVGDVQVGQRVEIKVDAFDFMKYGMLEGTIRTLSRDAVPPSEAAPGSLAAQQAPEPVYLARISLDRSVMGKSDLKITPGMGVTAEIKTGRRRVIDYFLSPVMEHAYNSLREK